MDGLLTEGGRLVLGYGLLGVLNLALAAVVVYLHKANQRCADQNRADALAFQATSNAVTKALDGLTAGLTAVNGRMDERTRVQETMIGAQDRAREAAELRAQVLTSRMDALVELLRDRADRGRPR